MKTYARMAALLLLTLCTPSFGHGQAKSPEQLGKVDFPNSCTPAVQPTFQRGVAMLHSFRYAEAEKTFREVLAQDPSCAIANWGIAAILMDNPLAAVGPSPQWAERAQAAIDQGRRIGAKTQLKEFETSQTREPDRFRGLYGAAQAAAQSGDIAKAKRYFARLVDIAGEGDSRPELARARTFLTAN